VIPFCGTVDEWPILSEKFLAKTQRYRFKEFVLGKLPFLKLEKRRSLSRLRTIEQS
jgi:hypothetical protein